MDIEKDIRHLKVVGWVHYASGILSGIILLILLFYILMLRSLVGIKGTLIGLAIISNRPEEAVMKYSGGDSEMIYVGAFLICFIFWTFLFTGTVVNFYCGKLLREQRAYNFCVVGTALMITSFPIGTAVGIYSLVILLREPVKKIFEINSAEPILE